MIQEIYLDTCALNRLTDEPSQPRIREEAAAVEAVLDLITSGEIRWVSSSVLKFELTRNPDPFQREDSLALLDLAAVSLTPDASTLVLAADLRAAGFGDIDAVHLALAEQHHVPVLLTVDDRFIRRSAGRQTHSAISVMNPIDWVRGRKPWLIKS